MMDPPPRRPPGEDSTAAADSGSEDPTALGVDLAPVGRYGPGPPPPAQLAGYRVDGELGRGGMGVVYRAVHMHLQRSVALKVLAPELADDAAFRERFIRESRTAAALRHPNIVTIYDAGDAGGLLYMAMEYVEGIDLAHRLESGPLDPAHTVAVLGQVAAALDAAHAAGLVHRDVKPGNILLERDHAYLTDFGLAKQATGGVALTRIGQVVGSLNYLAPEQIEGGTVDGRTDVYGLGCVLFHCLAGAPPYRRDSDVQVMFAHVQDAIPSLQERRPDLPADVDAVLRHALAKRRDERPASAGALMDALHTALGMRGHGHATLEAAAGAPVVVVAAREQTVRLLARGALATGGFRVVEEPDLGRLPARVARERPAVVVAAWQDLEPSGEEASRRLRAASPGVRLLAIGPRAPDRQTRAALSAHADDFLLRPFSALHLLMKVRDMEGTADA